MNRLFEIRLHARTGRGTAWVNSRLLNRVDLAKLLAAGAEIRPIFTDKEVFIDTDVLRRDVALFVWELSKQTGVEIDADKVWAGLQRSRAQ